MGKGINAIVYFLISKIHSLVLDSSWTGLHTINGANETHPYHFWKIAQNSSRKSGLKSLEVRQKSKGVKRHAVKGQNVMLHMLYDIGAMGLLGHKLSSNSRQAKNFGASTMRTNQPKLLDLPIFCT